MSYGVLALLIGGVWFFQGINVLLGSFMSGQPRWAIIGGVVFLLGLALLFFSNHRRAESGDAVEHCSRVRGRACLTVSPSCFVTDDLMGCRRRPAVTARPQLASPLPSRDHANYAANRLHRRPLPRVRANGHLLATRARI